MDGSVAGAGIGAFRIVLPAPCEEIGKGQVICDLRFAICDY
jgi:hypothetical protein